MKAIQFHEFNGPLTLDEIARPEAGDGQSLVKVAATSFNPVEAAFRAGLMPVELPHIPGLDVSGTVPGARSSASCRWGRTAPPPSTRSRPPTPSRTPPPPSR